MIAHKVKLNMHTNSSFKLDQNLNIMSNDRLIYNSMYDPKQINQIEQKCWNQNIYIKKKKNAERQRGEQSQHLQLSRHLEGQLTTTNPWTTSSNPLKTTFIHLLKMMCKHVYFKNCAVHCCQFAIYSLKKKMKTIRHSLFYCINGCNNNHWICSVTSATKIVFEFLIKILVYCTRYALTPY